MPGGDPLEPLEGYGLVAAGGLVAGGFGSVGRGAGEGQPLSSAAAAAAMNPRVSECVSE